MRHYIDNGTAEFLIDISFSDTIHENETYIKFTQNVIDGYNGRETPCIFAKGILIAEKLKKIKLTENSNLNLDKLTHSGKKIVAVKYAQVDISGEDKIAIQFVNHVSEILLMKMSLPLEMPIYEPDFDEYGKISGGEVVDYERVDGESVEVEVNLILDKNDLLILPVCEFIKRVHND